MKKIAYIINADWYFLLHWLARAEAAMRAGWQVHVLTRLSGPEAARQLRQHGFFCHRLALDRKSMNPFTDLRTAWQIHRLLREIEPDLVHCITVKPNLYGGIAARMLGLPSILSVTGLGLLFSGSGIGARAARQVVLPFYRLAAGGAKCRLLFENEENRKTFAALRIGLPRQYRVIAGSGVDLRDFSFVEESEEKPPTILFAARMLWDKGIADLVEAADLLRRQGYVFRLEVAGIVDEASRNAVPIRQIEAWHAAGALHWLGEVKEMPRLLGRAHVVALPSCYGEGVPRVLIEAAAVGRAIVATDTPGCRDIVRDGLNGLLVAPKSPPQLAHALAKLLDDPLLRRQFGRNGRRLAEDVFAQEKVVEETLHLYETVIENT